MGFRLIAERVVGADERCPCMIAQNPFANMAKAILHLLHAPAPQSAGARRQPPRRRSASPMRAPECGVANPVRARTVAPRSRTCVITHNPFGNPPKAVSRFAECIPASSNAGCGKGGSFERSEGTLKTLSFAGKKSRKRDEWAFLYVQTNFSSRRKELFPLIRSQIERVTYNLIYPQ